MLHLFLHFWTAGYYYHYPYHYHDYYDYYYYYYYYYYHHDYYYYYYYYCNTQGSKSDLKTARRSCVRHRRRVLQQRLGRLLAGHPLLHPADPRDLAQEVLGIDASCLWGDQYVGTRIFNQPIYLSIYQDMKKTCSGAGHRFQDQARKNCIIVHRALKDLEAGLQEKDGKSLASCTEFIIPHAWWCVLPICCACCFPLCSLLIFHLVVLSRTPQVVAGPCRSDEFVCAGLDNSAPSL